jgi:hypothetical protein
MTWGVIASSREKITSVLSFETANRSVVRASGWHAASEEERSSGGLSDFVRASRAKFGGHVEDGIVGLTENVAA